MIRFLMVLMMCVSITPALGYAKNVVNVYAWGGELPKEVINQFEKETGIKVNFSTYDNNETLYAKLKISAMSGKKSTYDVILPSNYFVERMRKQGLLLPLDHQQIPNLVNLDRRFTNPLYDPNNQHSVPIIWGSSGIFYNESLVSSVPRTWQALWGKQWKKQLMLLDDMREIFAIALMSLGFDPNDSDPKHIELAYKQLLALVPNIKLFASESIQAIIIDEDAIAGVAWNADAFKANTENKNIKFQFPEDGFILWVDCLAIPSNPPHLKEAYAFINFLLRPEIGKDIALHQGHAITNFKSRSLLPEALSKNKMIYPSDEILKRGHWQTEVNAEALKLYSDYWQKLKLAF